MGIFPSQQAGGGHAILPLPLINTLYTRTPPPNPSTFFPVQLYSKNLNYIFSVISSISLACRHVLSSIFFSLFQVCDAPSTRSSQSAAGIPWHYRNIGGNPTTPRASAQGHVATEQTSAQTIWNNSGHFCLPDASCSSHRTVFKALTPMNYKAIQKKSCSAGLALLQCPQYRKASIQGLVIMSQAEGWVRAAMLMQSKVSFSLH